MLTIEYQIIKLIQILTWLNPHLVQIWDQVMGAGWK